MNMIKTLTAVLALSAVTATSAFADEAKAAPYQGTAQMATAATPDDYEGPITGGVDWNLRAKTSESFKAAHQFDARQMENNQNGG